MATYNSLISRTDAAALIPEEVSREIIQAVPESSAVMRLARRLPNMSRKQRRMPVLSGLVTAYFVTGDNGLKQTSEAAWENKYINAEELAVIVPIPEAVLDDVDYDVWAEIRPNI
ncbi:MAG: phage major capsid protein, partial [Caldilineaceae bacterium]|nr:phage major capsid protein [Caldilineaceae bacterium]